MCGSISQYMILCEKISQYMILFKNNSQNMMLCKTILQLIISCENIFNTLGEKRLIGHFLPDLTVFVRFCSICVFDLLTLSKISVVTGCQ